MSGVHVLVGRRLKHFTSEILLLSSVLLLGLLASLDFHQPHVVAIQETKIDSSIATLELFPETCPYSVYRKDYFEAKIRSVNW